jgi:uncharacterized membrane protein YphA (DoxX/SURF4 family)
MHWLKEFGKNALGPLMLRMALALIFIVSGLPKINENTRWGLEWAAGANPPPEMVVIQAVVSWGEVVGGVLLAVGLLTRLCAFVLFFVQGGAMYVLSQQHAFFDIGEQFKGMVGPEYNLALMAMCAALFFMGAGSIALDRFFRSKPKAAAGQASVAVA